MSWNKVLIDTYNYLRNQGLLLGTSARPLKSTAEYVAIGKIEGSAPFGAFGKIDAASALTNQVLWADGEWEAPPSEGCSISIVSTSAEDGVGGTGIRELHIHYLDADLEPQIEITETDGTTDAVMIAANVRFLQCAHLTETGFGSTKAAVGIITFRNTSTGAVYNQIDPNENRCTSSARMVPKGKRAIITGMVGSSISGAASTASSISIASTYFYDIDYTADSILIPFGSVGLQDGSEAFNLPIPAVFPEGSVIAMICTTDKAAIITGDWFGYTEDDI